MEDRGKIREFLDACDDMINGKFIMADYKISTILKTIATNDKLYRFVNDCLLGYNFQKEYDKALIDADNGIFQIPDNPKRNIAFVMCLFLEVDHHRIKFYEFIGRFFKGAGAGNEYAEFVKTMLVPFKENISNQFDINTCLMKEYKDEEPKEDNNVFLKAIEQLKFFKNEVLFDNKLSPIKKEEINIYIEGCLEALRYKNIKLISALITALDKEVKKEKSLRSGYASLTKIFLEIYN